MLQRSGTVCMDQINMQYNRQYGIKTVLSLTEWGGGNNLVQLDCLNYTFVIFYFPFLYNSYSKLANKSKFSDYQWMRLQNKIVAIHLCLLEDIFFCSFWPNKVTKCIYLVTNELIPLLHNFVIFYGPKKTDNFLCVFCTV